MVLPTSLFTLALALLPALALTATPPTQQQHPPPPLYTATLHHLPVTTSPPTDSPKPLATLTYSPHHPHLSTLTSFTPPPNSSDPNSLTQIAIYLPNKDTSSRRLRTSATTTYAFHAPYRGRFRIVVDPATGDIVGATWHAYLLPLSSSEPLSESKSKIAPKDKGTESGEEAGTRGRGRGDFDIVPVARAPAVVFDKVAKGKGSSSLFSGGAGASAEGGEEEVGEKTFLQKYWWLLIGVAVLAMSGGGGEK